MRRDAARGWVRCEINLQLLENRLIVGPSKVGTQIIQSWLAQVEASIVR